MASQTPESEPPLARLIAEHLSLQDPRAVLAILERYGQKPYERETERVRAAAVRLSGGSLPRLGELIAEARVDYRDLLYRLELEGRNN